MKPQTEQANLVILKIWWMKIKNDGKAVNEDVESNII